MPDDATTRVQILINRLASAATETVDLIDQMAGRKERREHIAGLLTPAPPLMASADWDALAVLALKHDKSRVRLELVALLETLEMQPEADAIQDIWNASTGAQ